MSTLAELGIMHLEIDGDLYCGSKKAYPTREGFVEAALRESCLGDDLMEKLCLFGSELSEEMLTNRMSEFVLPRVSAGFMIHRLGPSPDPFRDDDQWWEYGDEPGPGRSPVWSVDVDEIPRITGE